MGEAGARDVNTSPVATAPSPAAEATGITVSLEVLIWFGLIVAAAALRLLDLDGLPLTTDEASRALDAARVADGDVPETWRGDLVAAGTSYLFRIFGEDEFVARVVPAMAGAAVVPVLWFARPYAGKLAALVAASLVTISPLFVLYSRSATQYSAGCLLAAVMMVCLFGYLSRPRTGVAFPLVVALALAPLTDAPAVVAALAVLVFLMLESTVFANRDVRAGFQGVSFEPLAMGERAAGNCGSGAAGLNALRDIAESRSTGECDCSQTCSICLEIRVLPSIISRCC